MPLKTLHYTPSLWSPLFPLKTILESSHKRSCLLAVNCYTVSNWGIQMSAVVKTNAQWWVLIPLSLSGGSQRQQSGSAHSNSTHSWLDAGRAQPLRAGSTTASCLLGSALPLSLRLSPTRLWLGNLKGRHRSAIMTEYSSTSPYDAMCVPGSFETERNL